MTVPQGAGGRIRLDMFRNLTSLITILLLVSLSSSVVAQRTRSTSKDKDIDAAAAAQKQAAQQELLEEEFAQVIPRGLDAPVNPDEYVIGPSDEFLLVFRGQEQKNIRVRVLPEGTILLPSHGAMKVAGLTITEFRGEIRSILDKYYRNVDFECQLINPRSFVVYVLGEVTAAGAVELHVPFRVNTAVESAGGISDRGSLRYIEIRENGETVRTVDLFRFLRLGDVGENPALSEGQSVYVPVRQALVSITGQVWNQGTYEILPGETIEDLIEFTGGLVEYADTARVVVEKYDGSSRPSIDEYKLDDILSMELDNRDIVVIPDKRMFDSGSYVLVRGGGGRTGKVFIEDGETLTSFLPRFVRLGVDYEIDRAVIEREAEDGSMQYIPVDLESIISGEGDGSIELQNGDIISIPASDNLVYVTGEVVVPGEVEFQKGLPAERYIALSGGPTRAGSMNKITIYSIDGTVRKGDRSSMVYRGDTVLLERTRSSYIGPLFVGFTSITSLILSVIAVSK